MATSEASEAVIREIRRLQAELEEVLKSLRNASLRAECSRLVRQGDDLIASFEDAGSECERSK